MVFVPFQKSLFSLVQYLQFSRFSIGGAIVFILITLSGLTNAESTTGHANVTLLDTINFEELKAVDYGTLVNENGRCSLISSGELVGSNGSNCNGQGQVGEFVISGAESQSVTISVAAGESLSGITYTPQLLSHSSAVLVDGQTTALVGGSLDLSNANHGSHALSYTISVNYD